MFTQCFCLRLEDIAAATMWILNINALIFIEVTLMSRLAVALCCSQV